MDPKKDQVGLKIIKDSIQMVVTITTKMKAVNIFQTTSNSLKRTQMLLKKICMVNLVIDLKSSSSMIVPWFQMLMDPNPEHIHQPFINSHSSLQIHFCNNNNKDNL